MLKEKVHNDSPDCVQTDEYKPFSAEGSLQPDEKAPFLDFRFEPRPVYHFFKRIMDIALSLLAFAVLLVFILAALLAVAVVDPGNPFFIQERVGKNGKPFKMYKIRTMRKNAEEIKAEFSEMNEDSGSHFKLSDDPRTLGRLGKFLRKTSIDELPQLINIIKGDMSIIGPRPFVPNECENLCRERQLVRPGLSCYWQIYGKNCLSDEMSDYYDKKYIMDRSLFTDVKIILKTIVVVLKLGNN